VEWRQSTKWGGGGLAFAFDCSAALLPLTLHPACRCFGGMVGALSVATLAVSMETRAVSLDDGVGVNLAVGGDC
jgi:hypothetical protein